MPRTSAVAEPIDEVLKNARNFIDTGLGGGQPFGFVLDSAIKRSGLLRDVVASRKSQWQGLSGLGMYRLMQIAEFIKINSSSVAPTEAYQLFALVLEMLGPLSALGFATAAGLRPHAMYECGRNLMLRYVASLNLHIDCDDQARMVWIRAIEMWEMFGVDRQPYWDSFDQHRTFILELIAQ